MTTKSQPLPEEQDEIEQLLSGELEGESKTYAQILLEGVPHKGGLAQLAEALPELLGFAPRATPVEKPDRNETGDPTAPASRLPAEKP